MPERLDDLIGGVLSKIADKRPEWRPSIAILQRVWSELVAPDVASFTRPMEVDWEVGLLAVGVDSEARLAEIERHRRQFEARLDERLPWPLDDVVFEVVESRRTNAAADSEETTETGEETPPEPASTDSLDERRQTVLEQLDPETRTTALRILNHVRDETDD